VKFSIMDQTGHSTEQFETANKTTLEAAMARFEELTNPEKDARCFRAAARFEPGGEARLVKAFDPSAVEYVFFPPLQGG
jgi:hypothetical protein